MLAKSVTPATPVTRPKSHISESSTWVKQWYNPLENNNSGSTNYRLKGWIKTQAPPISGATSISSDTFNLDQHRIQTEHVDANLVTEVKPTEETANSDLKSALSMEKRDDQVSSLSGLGM